MMKASVYRIGVWGAVLGMLSGLIETTVGASIRPWIGNKENPLILGLVTLLLSGLALAAVLAAWKQRPHNADRQLATIFGVLLPAGVCFTTVGALWYLPGILLSLTAACLISDFYRNRPRTAIHPWRWISGVGALIGLSSFFAAFWLERFGLFREMVFVGADRLVMQIMPMDILRRTVYAFGATRVETLESGAVMTVYLLFVLGAGVSLLASLASSRLFTRIGGGISLAGAIFFLWQLTAILMQANYTSAFPLWISLGWGWYLSMLGTALTFLGAFWRDAKPGTLFNLGSLPGRKLA